MSIYSLDEALLTVKEGSRERYSRVWKEYLDFCSTSSEFAYRMPSEYELITYFKHLREVKKMASSSLWTYYSMINSVVKGIYGEKMQKYPRITMLLKVGVHKVASSSLWGRRSNGEVNLSHRKLSKNDIQNGKSKVRERGFVSNITSPLPFFNPL